MQLAALRDFCLSQPGVTEGLPFGPEVLVFKVGGKMFATMRLAEPLRVNLKCEPERALELREAYSWITPGYHANKRHWNTLTPPPTVPLPLLYELIMHAYALVVEKLPKSQREALSIS